MLRLNELKLPLNHSDVDLTSAIIQRLQINAEDLLNVSIFKRSYDARKKTNIFLIYQVDVELTKNIEVNILQQVSQKMMLEKITLR